MSHFAKMSYLAKILLRNIIPRFSFHRKGVKVSTLSGITSFLTVVMGIVIAGFLRIVDLKREL